ncbi:helix-turn-helix transcriptional regulator [Bacteroides sp. GD17]|jgi:ribosome-binding protein aMBF1 (putative translation factor)|uniref:helix-turn-helix domain-containing protein n=1 Tax=Bacteroides sp. GD17 TaxID=3139826 RepID=UPI0025E9731A|nr:helix-turn-helix transcriptional regulator [uncultured Bacteroides sp.]
MSEKELKMFDVDAQLDAAFGREGTQERRAAEDRANAFFTGQIIEEARKKANMTQEELAEKIGTNKSYISRVEKGRTEPKVSTFYRIVSALGLNVELTPAM